MGRHIELLEAQLGVVLFERTGRALLPTNKATAIATASRDMQNGVDQICRLVQSQETELNGTVQISAGRSVAINLLPDIVPGVQKLAPDIDIAIVATDKVSNLLRRDADIAVRMVRPNQASLIAKRLGEFAIVPCASQSYIDRWGLPKTIKELLQHRIIGGDQDKEIQQGMARAARALNVDPETIRVVLQTDDHVARAAAASAGIGIGFLTEYMLKQIPNLKPLPLELSIPSLPVWLAVHREIRTTPRIRGVFDELSVLLRENMSS